MDRLGQLCVAEHFTVARGAIARIRQIHDTAGVRAAGFAQHSPIHAGRVVWNRSQKHRDPDTGKRVMRMRPKEEWVYAEAPQLRIVSEELWEAVQKRRDEQRRSARGNTTGRKP